jgi:hypothetical protein
MPAMADDEKMTPNTADQPLTTLLYGRGQRLPPEYGPQGNAFDGIVKGVHLANAEAEKSGHLISSEEIACVAMPRQQLTGIPRCRGSS